MKSAFLVAGDVIVLTQPATIKATLHHLLLAPYAPDKSPAIRSILDKQRLNLKKGTALTITDISARVDRSSSQPPYIAVKNLDASRDLAENERALTLPRLRETLQRYRTQIKTCNEDQRDWHQRAIATTSRDLRQLIMRHGPAWTKIQRAWARRSFTFAIEDARTWNFKVCK